MCTVHSTNSYLLSGDILQGHEHFSALCVAVRLACEATILTFATPDGLTGEETVLRPLMVWCVSGWAFRYHCKSLLCLSATPTHALCMHVRVHPIAPSATVHPIVSLRSSNRMRFHRCAVVEAAIKAACHRRQGEFFPPLPHSGSAPGAHATRARTDGAECTVSCLRARALQIQAARD